MSEFYDKTVCVVDQGQFMEMAIRLSRDFKRVLYYKPWKSPAPHFRRLILGDGFPEVDRIRDLFDVVDDVDLFVFPDVYDGDLQLHLEKMGKRVWGSRKGERFEFRRALFKRTLKEVGLETGEYYVIEGMTKLREFFQEHGDEEWVVKRDLLRGDGETFKWENPEVGESQLKSMDYYYAEAGDSMTFVVEKKIDSVVEPGYDGITVDGQFTDGLIDYEIKNHLTAAAWSKYEDMSEYVRTVNEAFAEKLKDHRVRSTFGTEIIVDEQGAPHFIDATMRLQSPPGEMLLEMVDNLSEIIWHGSEGEFVQAKPAAPFGVELILYTDWEHLSLAPIIVPEDIRRWVKLSSACRLNGVDYSIQYCGEEQIPWMKDAAAMVIGLGDTLESAYETAMEHAHQIKGANLEITGHEMAEAIERINAGKKEGVDFPGEVPEPAIVLESND